MTRAAFDFPVFDADNHLYETREALTKFLPERYRGAVDYVDVRGRTKIVVQGRISEYIPNPTFDVVARPGAQEDYFRKGNPEEAKNKPARDLRGADARPPSLSGARAASGPHGRAGARPGSHVPHPGQPGGGAHAAARSRK